MKHKAIKPKEKWASLGEIRMRYLDSEGDGPIILALHGLASSAHWYDLIAPEFGLTHRTIIPDQRGHGKTTQAPTGYDWQTLGSDVIGLLDHVGAEECALLGHSWGGNVAINVAAAYPQRISSLVLIDGGFFGARLQNHTTWEEFKERASPRDVSGTREEFLARIEGQLQICWSDDIKRIVQSMVWEDRDGEIHDLLHPQNHEQVMHAMWHNPASAIWPRILTETLIVAAGPTPERALNEFTIRKKEMVKIAAREIKNSRVHWIPETIHDIGYHKPKELAEVIVNFLSRSA